MDHGKEGQAADPIEALRASLLAAQPKQSMSRQAQELLAAPELLQLPRVPRDAAAWRAALLWLPARLGVSHKVFAIGLQMVAAYTTGSPDH